MPTSPDPLPPGSHPSEVPEEVLFDGHPALLPTAGAVLVAVLTLGLGMIYFALRRLGIHYRITNQRVVIERGLLSKRMDQIDIYRINDYVVERPFGQRLLGTGNLVLSAMDRSSPDIRLAHLKTDVLALYEQLRKATEREKRRRGVRVLDTEIQH